MVIPRWLRALWVRRAPALLVLGALTAISGAVAAVLCWAGLSVRQCVPLDATGSWLAMRLDIVRTVSGCPAGTLGVSSSGIVTVLASIALPILIAQVLASVGGVGVAVVLRRALAGVVRLVGAVVGHKPRLEAPVITARPTPVLGFVGHSRGKAHHLWSDTILRGPPALPA